MHKTILTLIILLTFLPATVYAVPPPITLTADMKQAIPERQPVLLTLALHNNGSERLTINGSAFEASSFQITIMDSRGQAVPRTAFGERVLTPPTAVSANAIVELNPGQTLRYRFNLARLFDLSRAGSYAVSVSRHLWPQTWPPPPGNAPRQEMTLTSPLLKLRMGKDANADSGLTLFTLPRSHQTFLYMISRYDTGVSRCRVGEDGHMSFVFDPFQIAPVPFVGKGADSIVATPDGHFLYVGNSDNNTVSQFRIGIDGELSPLSPATVPAQQFSGLRYGAPKIYDPRHRPAQHARLPGLDPLSDSVAGPNEGRGQGLAFSPSGQFAFALSQNTYIANSDGSAPHDLIVPLRVAPDGTLTALPGPQIPHGPKPLSPGYRPPHCTMLTVDPTGRFLVVVNPAYLDCYRIGLDGSLTLLGTTTQEGNLDSVFFLPGGHIVYALNHNPPSLQAFRFDNQHGLVPAGLDMPNGVPFAASIASAVAPTPLHWGPNRNGLEMSARLPDDVMPVNTPIVLTVMLRNVTSHPIRLSAPGMDMALFHLVLVGPHRQFPGVLRGGVEWATEAIPLLAAGHDLLNSPGTGGAALVLPPGRQRQYRFILSRLADLTVAGNYTIQVSRRLSSGKTVSAPTVHVLLEGPFNGITRSGNGEELNVL